MTQSSPNLNELLDGLAHAVQPVVEIIEGRLPTTKGHYGDYMAAIPEVVRSLNRGSDDAQAQKRVYMIVGIALQRAGANKDGVVNALKALGAI